MDAASSSSSDVGFSLSRLPVELLASITSHFTAFYHVTALNLTGDRTLIHKLKHGGVVKVTLAAVDDSKTRIGDWLRYSGLTELVIDDYDFSSPDKSAMMSSLPRSLVKLSITNADRAPLLFSLWPQHLMHLSHLGGSDVPTSSGNSLLPNLQSLHFAYPRAGMKGRLNFPVAMIWFFLSSLPPSLTYLHLPVANCLQPEDFKYLPPNLSKLRGLELRIPTIEEFVDFPSAATLKSAQFCSAMRATHHTTTNTDASPELLTTRPIHLPFPSMLSLHLSYSRLEHSLAHLLHLTKLDLFVDAIYANVLFSAIPTSLTTLYLATQKLVLTNGMQDLPPNNHLRNLRLDCASVTARLGHCLLDSILQHVPNIRVLEIPTVKLPAAPSFDLLASSAPESMRLETFRAVLSPNFFREISLSMRQTVSELKDLAFYHYATRNLNDTSCFHLEDLKDIPATVERLEVQDLRTRIGPDCGPSANCNPSSSTDRVPWRWCSEESLVFESSKVEITPLGASLGETFVHPFSELQLRPLPEFAPSSPFIGYIIHPVSMIRMLPRTLTALEIRSRLELQDALGFHVNEFPLLKSLKVQSYPTISLHKWTQLETLELSSAAFNWPISLPPNLTHLRVPFASSFETPIFMNEGQEDVPLSEVLLRLSKLSSLDMKYVATSQLGLQPPTSLTWLRGMHFDPRALELSNLATYDILRSTLTLQTLSDIYEVRGLALTLVGGIFQTNGNARAILQRLPPPELGSSNAAVISYYWKALLQQFPLWKKGQRSKSFETDILLEFRVSNGSSLV